MIIKNKFSMKIMIIILKTFDSKNKKKLQKFKKKSQFFYERKFIRGKKTHPFHLLVERCLLFDSPTHLKTEEKDKKLIRVF